MYAYVWGNSFSSTEYSIKYEFTPIHDSEPIYSPSYWLTSDLDGDGRFDVGDTFQFTISVIDLDGFLSGPSALWYLYDPDTATIEQFTHQVTHTLLALVMLEKYWELETVT